MSVPLESAFVADKLKFHEQTECVASNNSSLLRLDHIDHTEMSFLNLVY